MTTERFAQIQSIKDKRKSLIDWANKTIEAGWSHARIYRAQASVMYYRDLSIWEVTPEELELHAKIVELGEALHALLVLKERQKSS